MRLTLQTDYALRMMIHLGHAGQVCSADAIAAALGVSRNHLVKIAARLSEIGYLEARRGRGGGLVLARHPHDINVGEVVRAMEALGGFVECFDPLANQCRLAPRCGLQGVLRLALDDFLQRLDRYTLADLLATTDRPGA